VNSNSHWLLRSVLAPAALSNLALIVWAPVAIATALATMPYGMSVTDPLVWVVAIGAQVLFTALVIVGRAGPAKLRAEYPRVAVFAVLLIAGALRGAGLVIASAMVAGEAVNPSEVALRSVNSAIIAVLALGVLGAFIQATRDYRDQYAVLRERAIRLQREVHGRSATLSDATIAGWVGLQRSLRSTAAAARGQLAGSSVSSDSLEAVADVISDALTREVRPISHGLWIGSTDEPPKIRFWALALEALRPWSPPILSTVAIFAVIVGVGSVNRAGLVIGGVFAGYTTVTVAVVLVVSALIGSWLPRSRGVGIATLIMTPVLLVIVAVGFGQGIIQTQPDTVGAFITGISASIVIGSMVIVRRVTTERQMLLDALQARIDEEGLAVLVQRADGDEWGRALGTFVHHSVQSELSALRLQLLEAATEPREEGRARARSEALERFDRLLTLQPPWVQVRSGQKIIAEVAHAWAGIADVVITTTDGGTAEQWLAAGNVVEEGVANAVRAGGARRVVVDVFLEVDALIVTIDDDGQGLERSAAAGLGTWWLDHVAPNAWERHSSAAGTRLRVRLASDESAPA